jgi:uncharacterized protein (UPF0332 family)
MAEQGSLFLERAIESLLGAESELGRRRFNHAANRAYFACFQAAIAALQRAGIRAQGGEWSHQFVRSQFDGILVYRRKLYPSELRGVLATNAELRVSSDYRETPVSQAEVSIAVRRCRTFVEAIRAIGFRQ